MKSGTFALTFFAGAFFGAIVQLVLLAVISVAGRKYKKGSDGSDEK